MCFNNFMIKFGIYTSFYNCEKFIDNAFNQIESLNYDNFEWHIVDDFSTDTTKTMLMERLHNSPIKDKIKYYTQSVKKEMYWSPNLFFDNTFDWIVLMDNDDELDTNALNVYNKVLSEVNNDVVLISSDFHKINYSNNSLHSISYILNEENISTKINKYHPQCDYLNNISYSCFGHLRAFKNLPQIEFQIEDRLAGAEDSYHIFWINSYGKYLHIPRPLYKWNMHTNSESHSTNILPNFNGNFDMALDKLKNSDYGVDTYYNDVYVETCALGSYDFGKLNEDVISLWTKPLTDLQKKKLTNLYFDCILNYNNLDGKIHIICLNYFTESQLETLLYTLKDCTVLLYYQSDVNYSSTEEKDMDVDRILHSYLSIVNTNVGNYSWWKYIRHFVIKSIIS
jgi:glycosyltransferase involved in cell wall biosynthesis